MNFTLRPYQDQTIKLLREAFQNGSKRPILCLPTGAGKTVTFSQIADAATKKGNRVLVVCHRKELIEQAKRTMEAYGVDLLRVSFGMVQTLQRNPQHIPSCSVCIVDECHTGNFRKFVELLPPSVMIIGATATPISATKKNPLRNTFTDVIAPVSISQLIDAGYLAEPLHIMAAIDESRLRIGGNGDFTTQSQNEIYAKMFSNIRDAYARRVGKTIIFTSSIEMTIDVAELLGVSYVHSNMSEADRDKVVADFKKTPGATIVNCGILTAGFDDPEIETVIVFRATTSLALWLQMCGRGSRVTESKRSFRIIDMGNNMRRHGEWHMERDWQLIFANEGKKIKQGAAIYKSCINEDCQCLIHSSVMKCKVCGWDQPKNYKSEQKAKTFIEIAYEKKQLPANLNKPISMMTAAELLQRAEIGNVKNKKPYSMGWVMRQLEERKPDVRLKMLREIMMLKNYKNGWFFHQKKRLGL